MSHLVLKPSVLLSAAPDGYLAYDVQSNRLHRLNPTAALIVELCDGTRDRGRILAAIEPLLPAGSAAECAAWLDRALDDGLLQNTPTATAEPWSAGGLHALATELRHRDRVLAAYICQERAAELAPEEPRHWYALGELAHIIGRRDAARAAYERYQQAHPADVEVEHLLIALRDDPPPQRAPDEYIEQLYAHFASFYDDNMRGDLDYRAPELLNAAIQDALRQRDSLRVLELGCGTGLFGKLARSWSRLLVGVDLSAAMIERARQRGIYDQLEKAEITAWLRQPAAEGFDVIAICDSLIYFGDLRPVFRGAKDHLAADGLLACTVEQGTTHPFHLSDSGRFTHHPDHLREAAREVGLQVVRQSAELLRYEYGEAVVGLVAVLR